MEESKVEKEQCMPRVNGERFWCEDCSCGVFTVMSEAGSEKFFRCNGCGSCYAGEKKEV